MTNALMINTAIGRSASKRETSLKNKVKASMRSVLEGNWLETKEDELFKASIGGALLDVGAESKKGELLIKSTEVLLRFSAAFEAAIAGVTVDFAAIMKDGDDKCLPLLEWWEEVKKEIQPKRC
jgi:hypothetical protein